MLLIHFFQYCVLFGDNRDGCIVRDGGGGGALLLRMVVMVVILLYSSPKNTETYGMVFVQVVMVVVVVMVAMVVIHSNHKPLAPPLSLLLPLQT